MKPGPPASIQAAVPGGIAGRVDGRDSHIRLWACRYQRPRGTSSQACSPCPTRSSFLGAVRRRLRGRNCRRKSATPLMFFATSTVSTLPTNPTNVWVPLLCVVHTKIAPPKSGFAGRTGWTSMSPPPYMGSFTVVSLFGPQHHANSRSCDFTAHLCQVLCTGIIS